MVLVEYQIPLPITVEEFKRAQLYMIIDLSMQETKGGEGVEWIKNESYDNLDGHLGVSPLSEIEVPRTAGQYTLKKYHLASRLPKFLSALCPRESLFLYEEAWNSFTHTLTVLSSGYFAKSKFKIVVESVYLDGQEIVANALHLSEAQLKEREVEVLDIATGIDPKAKDYKEGEDVTKCAHEVRKYGPYGPDWRTKHDGPFMCCYKLCTIYMKYFGIQTRGEAFAVNMQKTMFQTSMRRMICLQDKWFPLTFEDVRRLELENTETLNKQRLAGLEGKEGTVSAAPKEEAEAAAVSTPAAPAAESVAAPEIPGAEPKEV